MKGAVAPSPAHHEHLAADACDCETADSFFTHNRPLLHPTWAKRKRASSHLAFCSQREPAILELIQRHSDAVVAQKEEILRAVVINFHASRIGVVGILE